MRKILVFHHFGGIGGAGLSLLHILSAIDYNQNDVKVVCPGVPNDMVKAISLLNIEVIETNGTPKIFAHYNGGIKHFLSIRTFLNFWDIIKDYKKVKNIIENQSPDLVVVNSMTLFWIGAITKAKGLNAVCFHRESFQKGIFGFRSWIIKRGLSKYFKKVAFISKFDMEQAEDISSEKVLIYDKVNSSSYKDIEKKYAQNLIGLDSSFKYILYLGGFSKLKGSHIVVECMRFFKNKDIKLLFVRSEKAQVSKNSLKNLIFRDNHLKIMKIIKKYNLNNKIIFLDTINTPEIYYKASDVVTFPSTKAHQARPIYEAGFAEIPIVITDFDETKEFAINYHNALTFTNNNSKSLYEKIDICLSDSQLRQKLISNNLDKSKNYHDLSLMKNEIELLIREY